MCTSLSYRDAKGNVYCGRTMELTMDLPYLVAWFPAGFATTSRVAGHEPLSFASRHGVAGVAMPGEPPPAGHMPPATSLQVLEGLNTAGLTFSLLAYPAASGHQAATMTQAVLGASDLGLWILGQFATVAEAKAALQTQPITLQPVATLGGAESPFHYVVHDATGAALVIEFNAGVMALHDNPVGVMTNGPDFRWHLTNLSNYTHLTNVDTATARFGSFQAAQPDSGIATAGLPSSNTSVGRFVRAAYYAQFTEKAATPDAAVLALAHIMNNFDRPRGATIDLPSGTDGTLELAGLPAEAGAAYATEFTSWTCLDDLDRKLFLIRDHTSLGYARLDLAALASVGQACAIPLKSLCDTTPDATARLSAAPAPPA